MGIFSFDKIGGLLVFAGIVLFGIGTYLNVGLLGVAGFALAGGGGALMGLNAILSGEISMRRGRRRGGGRTTYTGISARLVGLVLLLVGVGAIAASLYMLRNGFANASPLALRQLVQTDLGLSIASIGVGIAIAIWGLVNIVGSNEQNRSAGAVVMSLPLRLISVLMVLAGGIAIAYGAARLFAPQLIDTVLQALGWNF